MLTNVIALGAAYQHGLLPLTADAIEAAIELNGVAVAANQQAFRYGRLWVADRPRVEAMIAPPATGATTEFGRHAARLDRRQGQAAALLWQSTGTLPESTRRLLAVRIPELVDYQDGGYAAPYVAEVLRVATREAEVSPGSYGLTDAVVRGLYKLMAFKDEFEVTRLYLKPDFAEHVAATFDGKVTLAHNLQPPMVRRFGKQKLRVPAAVATPAFRRCAPPGGCAAPSWTPSSCRPPGARNERPSTLDTAVAIAELPDGIRGYEDVKRRNVRQVRNAPVNFSRASGGHG